MCKTYFTLSAELNESTLVISPEAFRITLSVIRTTKPWGNNTVEGTVERFINSVRMIHDLANGRTAMNKSMLDGHKSIVQNALYSALEAYASAQHMKPHDARDEIEMSAYYKSMTNLIEVPRFLKAFEKHEKRSDFLTRKVALAREFLPIAKTYEIAKTKVVSGRIPDPNAKPKEINPNRIDGTCSWCRRTIAITKDQRMAHHGYQRPGWGAQTPSCGGIGYKCLEVSDEGLRAMRKWCVESLASHRKQLAELPSKTEIVRKDPYSGKRKTYTPSDPKWAVVVREVRNGLESTIRQLEQNTSTLENEIRNWKPTEVRKRK